MSAINRDSFVFYKSFFEAIEECPMDNQRNIYRAIAYYALYGEVDTSISGVEKAVFAMAKPQLDANTQRWINSKQPKKQGARCGAPKGNRNAAKNKGDEPEPEPGDPDPESGTLSGEQFFSDKENRNRLDTFAASKGYSQDDVENFIFYNLNNTMAFRGSGDLLDKNGNVIQNVYGAFLNFVNSGYNREDWLKEHGIKKGESLNQNQNNSGAQASIHIRGRGFFNFSDNIEELGKFAVSNGFSKDSARTFVMDSLKNSPKGDGTNSLFGTDGAVVNDVCSAFLDYANSKTKPKQ